MGFVPDTFWLCLFRKKINGNRERLPKIKRIPLKANGPTYSMPERWATKPKPQIPAVSSNRTSALRARLFTIFLL